MTRRRRQLGSDQEGQHHGHRQGNDIQRQSRRRRRRHERRRNDFGDDGNDIIHGLGGVDHIYGGSENDWLYGDGEGDFLYGGDDHDWLFGGSGADYLNGGPGYDVAMYGGSPVGVVVSLATGVGYYGDAEGDTLVLIESVAGSPYDDFIVGNGGSNTLTGYGGHDTLKGGGGVDALYGSEGNDVLEGGASADTLDGGPGSDTAFYGGSGEGVRVSLWSGSTSDGDAQGDILVSIENVTGSGYDDALGGDDGVNVLDGQGGPDTLHGGGDVDILWGGEDLDHLHGMEGNDILYGENGNDWLWGESGFDTMIGGLGDDYYIVGSQFDTITELSGQGIRHGLHHRELGAAPRRLHREAGGLQPISHDADQSDRQFLPQRDHRQRRKQRHQRRRRRRRHGGHGDDDLYIVDNANDSVDEVGGDGSDTVYASVSWTLTAGADVETLATTSDAGTAAIDLTGNASGNMVCGNAGNNVINGGGGSDELIGLGGQDHVPVQYRAQRGHQRGRALRLQFGGRYDRAGEYDLRRVRGRPAGRRPLRRRHRRARCQRQHSLQQCDRSRAVRQRRQRRGSGHLLRAGGRGAGDDQLPLRDRVSADPLAAAPTLLGLRTINVGKRSGEQHTIGLGFAAPLVRRKRSLQPVELGQQIDDSANRGAQ